MGQNYRQLPDDEDDHLENMPRRPAGSGSGAGGSGGDRSSAVPARATASPPPPSTRPAPPPPDRSTLYVPADGGRGPAAGPVRNTGNACIWLLALAAVVVLACGLLGAGALQKGFDGITGMVPRFPSFGVTPTVVIQSSGPPLIQQVQALSRLETSSYSVQTVLTGESTGPVPPLTSDKILFIARGRVIAGVDLSKMREEDIVVVSDTVTIRMPAAEIFSTYLDNDKSQVYSRDTGFFTKADPNLETQVRQKAEQDILNQAVEDGILTKAQENAQTTMRTLLHGLHYDNVTFLPPLAAIPTAPVLFSTPTP